MVHQFEKVTLWKTLVTATPWNYDYLLYKNHMLLLVTSDACETCAQANEVFVGSTGECEVDDACEARRARRYDCDAELWQVR